MVLIYTCIILEPYIGNYACFTWIVYSLTVSYLKTGQQIYIMRRLLGYNLKQQKKSQGNWKTILRRPVFMNMTGLLGFRACKDKQSEVGEAKKWQI